MAQKSTRALFILWDDIAMIILALISAGLLLFEFTTSLSLDQVRLLDLVDISIALIFLTEFLVRFLLAPQKSQYLKRRWWELFTCIPITTPGTQALRILRLLRLAHLIRLNPRKDS